MCVGKVKVSHCPRTDVIAVPRHADTSPSPRTQCASLALGEREFIHGLHCVVHLATRGRGCFIDTAPDNAGQVPSVHCRAIATRQPSSATMLLQRTVNGRRICSSFDISRRHHPFGNNTGTLPCRQRRTFSTREAPPAGCFPVLGNRLFLSTSVGSSLCGSRIYATRKTSPTWRPAAA